ncbi:MAG: hypothetical protein P8Y70_05655 [Candidatus Lokiarchaeota archaeon]
MQNNQEKRSNKKKNKCPHNNIKQEGGFFVCQDCGLILDDNVAFEKDAYDQTQYYDDSQRDYERRIRIKDNRAKQDPKIKEKYDKIKILQKWFRDYKTNFTEQKKTIELLKGFGIGLNIDQVKYSEIKDRYLKYNRIHRKTYQNMVIIFLAIVWMEIKDTTNVRIEEFIDAANQLGHKINKKMLNNAMLKILKTEKKWKEKSVSKNEIEKEIKEKIKILFQKNLNDIPFEEVKEYFNNKSEFNKIKIEMQLLADKLLDKIDYKYLQNLNYKAFTAGLIYYIGQTLNEKTDKIFIQSRIEDITKFSSTTIRKKYHMLIEILGDP